MTVFYTFAFDLGSKLSFGGAVQKLLDAEIAETMAISAMNDVQLAPRYQELASSVTGAKSLIESEEWMRGERKLRDLSWRSRMTLARLLVTTLLMRVRRRRSGGQVESDDDTGDRFDVKKEMLQVIQEIDEAVTDRRLYVGIQAAMDRKLHEPGYLDRVPFIRLQLRNFQYSKIAKISTFSEEDNDTVHSSEVTLLVHRSGVALLTIALQLSGDSDADSYLELVERPSNLKFPFTLVSEPVLRGASRSSKVREEKWFGEWIPEIHEGTRWRTFEHAGKGVSLASVFRMYQDAINNLLGGSARYEDWMCYPTIFVDSLRCCKNRRKWLARHADDLELFFRGEASSAGRKGKERASVFYMNDYSLNEGYSVWLAGGGTICVNWEFNSADVDLVHYFRWTTAGENAIVRYWQLRRLDHKISNLTLNRSSLESIMALMATDMRDYRHPYMPDGTAGEISLAITEKLGADTVLQNIESRLAIMHNLVSMRESARSSRRANRLAATAVLVALVVSLPAIEEALKIVSRVPYDAAGGYVAQRVVSLGAVPSSAWFIFLLLMLAVVFIALPFGRVRLPRLWKSKSKLDLDSSWNNRPFRVGFVDPSDEEEE